MKRFFNAILLTTVSFVMLSCSSDEKKLDANTYRSGSDQRPLVDGKYSLAKDRKDMESMRSEIPDDKRRENDELAFTLGLMSETKTEPQKIREQFDKVLRKKREIFDKDMTKERERFTKEERKNRESFLKSQTDGREVFQRAKHTKEERAEFFGDQDSRSKEYFANQRERRGDFESDMHERRKNFEDYAREKQNDFNQEHRAYVKRFEEWKKTMSTTTTTLPRPDASSGRGTGLIDASNSSGPGGAAGYLSPGSNQSEIDELEQGLAAAKKKGSSSLGSGAPGSGQ